MECHSARPRVLQTDHKLRVISAGLPVDGDLHHWALGFKLSSFYHTGQLLRSLLGNFQLAARRFNMDALFTFRFLVTLTIFGLRVIGIFSQPPWEAIQSRR